MNGFIDNAGRAHLEIELLPVPHSAVQTHAWIDTGFTGELVLPQSAVDQLQLTLSGTVGAVLADGSEVAMKTYECFIEWFNELRPSEVVANALLGVGLLLDHELRSITDRT